MKLVIKNQHGENLDLNVLPEDTFLDIQNRLLQNGKVILDLAKLATGSKPFSLTANVMEYFGVENKTANVPYAKQHETEVQPNVELKHVTEDGENILPNRLDYECIKLDNETNWEELQMSINNEHHSEEMLDQSQIMASK